MIFKSGPQGEGSLKTLACADQGGGLLTRKPDIQSDSKSRKPKFWARSHQTRNVRWRIYIYVYVYIYIYIYIQRPHFALPFSLLQGSTGLRMLEDNFFITTFQSTDNMRDITCMVHFWGPQMSAGIEGYGSHYYILHIHKHCPIRGYSEGLLAVDRRPMRLRPFSPKPKARQGSEKFACCRGLVSIPWTFVTGLPWWCRVSAISMQRRARWNCRRGARPKSRAMLCWRC